MPDRRKLVVHLGKLYRMVESAILNGPDRDWDRALRPGEEKELDWHPKFVHYANATYLIGMLAYLEGEDDEYSWNGAGSTYSDFDSFANKEGTKVGPTRQWQSYSSQDITKANLDVLVKVRNAVAHNDGDLDENRDTNSLAMATAAGFPGVKITGSVITLEDEKFCRYVRTATLAVRHYYGDV